MPTINRWCQLRQLREEACDKKVIQRPTTTPFITTTTTTITTSTSTTTTTGTVTKKQYNDRPRPLSPQQQPLPQPPPCYHHHHHPVLTSFFSRPVSQDKTGHHVRVVARESEEDVGSGTHAETHEPAQAKLDGYLQELGCLRLKRQRLRSAVVKSAPVSFFFTVFMPLWLSDITRVEQKKGNKKINWSSVKAYHGGCGDGEVCGGIVGAYGESCVLGMRATQLRVEGGWLLLLADACNIRTTVGERFVMLPLLFGLAMDAARTARKHTVHQAHPKSKCHLHHIPCKRRGHS